jgi:2'-5' RNA ligase
MPTLQFYRYFVGCRPGPSTRAVLAQAGSRAEQRLRPDGYHLTFCVIAEVPARDLTIAERVRAAFSEETLHSAPIPFGRVVGGPLGAMVKTIGRQDELQDLYVAIVCRLASQGFEPMHRKAGFRPHSTLGHDPCSFVRFNIAHEWIPGELLLIESEVGLTRHNVQGAWHLAPPRQHRLPFGGLFPPRDDGRVIAAASPARRSGA